MCKFNLHIFHPVHIYLQDCTTPLAHGDKPISSYHPHLQVVHLDLLSAHLRLKRWPAHKKVQYKTNNSWYKDRIKQNPQSIPHYFMTPKPQVEYRPIHEPNWCHRSIWTISHIFQMHCFPHSNIWNRILFQADISCNLSCNVQRYFFLINPLNS